MDAMQIALLRKLGNGGGGVQPDWNQSDPAAGDYVKNRPMYIAPGTLFEGTITAEGDEGPYLGEAQFEAFPGIKAGDSITVVYDGTQYDNTAIAAPEGSMAWGNLALLGGGADTGEPYVFMLSAGVGFGVDLTIFAETAGAHAIKITAPLSGQIPDDYLRTYVKVHTIPEQASIEDLTAAADWLTKNAVVNWGTSPSYGPCTKLEFDGDENLIAEFADRAGTQFLVSPVDGVYDANGTAEMQPSPIYAATLQICPASYTGAAVPTGNGVEILSDIDPVTKVASLGWDGVLNCAGVIVKSSTAESTKRFKITVDDSGAITATEVV